MKEVKLLVLEDDRKTAGQIKRELEGLGYTVSGVVHSGQEAIENPGETGPHVIPKELNSSSDILREIEGLRELDKKLAESNQLLETILDYTHMLVAYLDSRFNFVRVNRAYAEADQRDPSFFPGKNHFDLYPDAENEAIFQRVVDTGEPYFTYAKPFEYPDNPERGVTYWDWSLIPIKSREKTVTGLVLTLANVTDRIKAEEQIKASLQEKEVLLKEVHHRVKNNLQLITSLLNLQTRRIDDKKSLSVFEEYRNRVNSIALVHEKLYESKDLANIDFGDYIRSLTAQILSTYSARLSGIALRVEAEDVFLKVNKAIPCALIINELVTDSIKYRFPGDRSKGGQISLEFKTNRENATLIVSDNGVDLPDDFDINRSEVLGMQIINALIKQLRASMRVDRNEGTRFIIEFQI